MTPPTTYSGYPQGKRLWVAYEANQGRRVNGIGGYFSHGPQAGRFDFETTVKFPESLAKKRPKSREEQAEAHGVMGERIGPIDAECFVAFVWKLAGRPEGAECGWKRERPLVIAVDNYSVHKSERVKGEWALWEAADVHLFYLPSYSPELSEIEPIWRDVKYRGLTKRSFTSLGELLSAVKAALHQKADQLLDDQDVTHQTAHFLPIAA